jgi:inner membrane protein involved in colicin E2 resistance
MAARIAALILIFAASTIGWVVLGGVMEFRSATQDNSLKDAVGELWGTVHRQEAPDITYIKKVKHEITGKNDDEPKYETQIVYVKTPESLVGSDIDVSLDLEHRKKGLLWYSTYRVDYLADYVVRNLSGISRTYIFEYSFPSQDGIYDNFIFKIDGEKMDTLSPASGILTANLELEPGQSRNIRISYSSRGLDQWWYIFGENVAQVKDFDLTVRTNFQDIDFPDNSISPTSKRRTDKGWDLAWQYKNLISGIQIGVEMPQKMNPGPFVSRVTFFAPVSLFFFFFMVFIITLVKRVRIHPMNYFFLAASFFSFHLLMAYLVDHIDLAAAFVICTIVSMGLVISYMRLVIGIKFALAEIGISQFVYLVLFSSAFFLERMTGLSITILSILTLFVLMQFTGRLDWGALMAEHKTKKA